MIAQIGPAKVPADPYQGGSGNGIGGGSGTIRPIPVSQHQRFMVVRRVIQRAGLRVRRVRFVDGRASYLKFSALTYFLGGLYHLAVTRIPGLERFSGVIIAELEKPEQPAASASNRGPAAGSA